MSHSYYSSSCCFSCFVVAVVEVKHSRVCVVRVIRGEAEKPAAFATPDIAHKGRLNAAPVLVALDKYLMFCARMFGG